MTADLILFVIGCAGHASFLTACMNALYGRPLHKSFLRRYRLFMGLLAVGGPPAFLAAFGLGVTDLVAAPWRDGRVPVVWPYLALCLVVGGVVLPAVTLRRQIRPRPVPLADERRELLDVAARLGFKPAGTGKFRRMATLPGNQCFSVEFTTLTLALPDVPAAWDGLTILHLSDLHLCGTPDRSYYDCVVARCLEWGVPDLVAVTGDLVDTLEHHRWILPVLGRLRWSAVAYGIVGNHDLWREPERVRRRMRRAGMRVLGNGWERLTVRGEPLTVIGHEGPWFRPAPDLSDCPADGFRLLLSHTPDNIVWARRNGVRLMLSGHNHGGQIRVPVIGPIFVPSRYGRKYDGGTFFEPPTLLHVNRGLAGREPLRYNCRPQVSRIVLRAGGAGA